MGGVKEVFLDEQGDYTQEFYRRMFEGQAVVFVSLSFVFEDLLSRPLG